MRVPRNFTLNVDIIKFNCKFQSLNLNKHESILFESCRSLFWLKQKHCNVGYHNGEENEQKFLYTIAQFRLKDIIYPLSNFPPITAVLSNMEKYFCFDQNKIDS
ncbi:unnamed protein product [Rotaria sp. Silwood2]|nr:unnamed protein product [Rotaria sp. Silwood2]CAF3019646.1 unnamed protein product [Rotaria sp. Silwood2]CAF3342033.1 unnamed protein product [Rotaria sp. Silwood2]CAF4025574.1 unnamed protein product [Rotaria sp. Silwood2]CAF4028310.1 unnamed protein product [Rotaria sp. Silwood2]